MDGRSQGLEHLTVQELAEMEALIVQERQRRELADRELAEANALSAAYHRQVQGETHNGVPIWANPQLPMMGYFSGAVVWHNNQGWVNNQPGVNLTEPGAEGHTWTSWADAGIWVGDELPEEEVPDPQEGQTQHEVDSNPTTH
ncbi:minor tail protein [Corynebacterium phage PSonyx]|nr:minor tail protein [Corynebacterium phage PSonyx]